MIMKSGQPSQSKSTWTGLPPPSMIAAAGRVGEWQLALDIHRQTIDVWREEQEDEGGEGGEGSAGAHSHHQKQQKHRSLTTPVVRVFGATIGVMAANGRGFEAEAVWREMEAMLQAVRPRARAR